MRPDSFSHFSESSPLTEREQAAAFGGPVHISLIIPKALESVALVDAKVAAAVGGMGVSWWHTEVAALRAPQPVIRAVRCTRWTLESVREYWAMRASRGSSATEIAQLSEKAAKASAVAQANRRAKVALARG
jgi:predicted DNA-binding transcriptional regulator AlpA